MYADRAVTLLLLLKMLLNCNREKYSGSLLSGAEVWSSTLSCKISVVSAFLSLEILEKGDMHMEQGIMKKKKDIDHILKKCTTGANNGKKGRKWRQQRWKSLLKKNICIVYDDKPFKSQEKYF